MIPTFPSKINMQPRELGCCGTEKRGNLEGTDERDKFVEFLTKVALHLIYTPPVI